jgi:hypothetical protein
VKKPTDTTEYPDDLRRQNEDFVKSRIDDYFGLYHSAASRLTKPHQYRRGDLVHDTWTLWGMMWRDTVDLGLRSLRTANQIAEDTPVPAEPRRRVTEKFPISTSVRPVTVRCSDLVSTRPLPGGHTATHVVSAAEVELDPNPVLPRKNKKKTKPQKVAVSVNAAAPRGLYRGELVLFGPDPRKPVETIPIAIWVDGAFDRT